MKIVLSHDVDNLTRKEHNEDLIVKKMIIRAFIEFFLFRINFFTLKSRLSLIFKDNFTNIKELVALDKKYNTKATYFFATGNDNTLAYKAEAAKPHVAHIIENGLNVGIHGIAFDNFEKMKTEYDIFNSIHNIVSSTHMHSPGAFENQIQDLDSHNIGIRMHYLRRNDDTLGFMKKIGYAFDTTEYSPDLKQPYITEEGIVEIPFHIMDSYLFQEKGIQKHNLNYAINFTKKIIDDNINKDIILNINFHQEYFSNGWKDWMDWYIWVVEYAYNKKIQFTSYQEVVDELRNK